MLDSLSFSDARVVRLMNFDDPSVSKPVKFFASSTASTGTGTSTGRTTWRYWPTQRALDGLSTCARIEDPPSCDQVCRFEDLGRKVIDKPAEWDAKDEVVKEAAAAAKVKAGGAPPPREKERDKADVGNNVKAFREVEPGKVAVDSKPKFGGLAGGAAVKAGSGQFADDDYDDDAPLRMADDADEEDDS